jgi:phosphotransferase system enzyme I (PtsI)
MAGRPQSTPILLGLGLDELSAVPSYLPEVKRVIRSISLKQARRLATRALQMPGPREVKREMDKWLRDHQCGLDQRIGTYQEMKTEPHK